MKGIISMIEVMITGIILLLAFVHFFPKYSIQYRWDSVLLAVKVRDTLQTIDNLNKTWEFAEDTPKFEEFMENVLKKEFSGPITWWKEVDSTLPGGQSTDTPYFTEGHKETIVDVINTPVEFYVYSFTLGLGYPY